MEQYRDQPAHAEKIAYQQKLLQEDVVHIRAEISQVSTVRNGAAHTFIRLQMKSAALSLVLGQITMRRMPPPGVAPSVSCKAYTWCHFASCFYGFETKCSHLFVVVPFRWFQQPAQCFRLTVDYQNESLGTDAEAAGELMSTFQLFEPLSEMIQPQCSVIFKILSFKMKEKNTSFRKDDETNLQIMQEEYFWLKNIGSHICSICCAALNVTKNDWTMGKS